MRGYAGNCGSGPGGKGGTWSLGTKQYKPSQLTAPWACLTGNELPPSLPQTNPSEVGNRTELPWEVDTGGPSRWGQ